MSGEVSVPDGVVLCQANAQAFILAEDPNDGWKNQDTIFCTLTHIRNVKDGLKVELYDKNQKPKGVFKWNPNRVKSKDDSRYLVLLVKPWDKCKASDTYLTMTLKFHTDAGAQTWSSISEQMVEKLEGLNKDKPKKHEANDDDDEEDHNKRALEPGNYTIVSSKVDWVSFWSHLDEKKAHRTLLPVNSVVEISKAAAKKDTRGKLRTECKVIHLYYPQFSELAEDEVPPEGVVGWIKGNYLAKRAPNMPIISADERVNPKDSEEKYDDSGEILQMNNAFKEIQQKLSGLDRALVLRAIRVTLQHVIINPYRPRRLKKANAKHANIFLHECGPQLLAVVGFEVEGDKELYLPSAVAKTDLAKLILQKIADITRADLEKGKQAASNAKPKVIDPTKDLVTLNVGGRTFQTQKTNLKPCTNLDLDKAARLPTGEVWIDRDPDLFKDILKFLRDGKIPTGTDLFMEELAREANFYGLGELVAHLENGLDRMHTQLPSHEALDMHFLSPKYE